MRQDATPDDPSFGDRVRGSAKRGLVSGQPAEQDGHTSQPCRRLNAATGRRGWLALILPMLGVSVMKLIPPIGSDAAAAEGSGRVATARTSEEVTDSTRPCALTIKNYRCFSSPKVYAIRIPWLRYPSFVVLQDGAREPVGGAVRPSPRGVAFILCG